MANAESLIEHIYQGIKEDLTTGVILPGQRMNITKYCDQFRVSKSPVRNAMYRLVGEGLLEPHPHDGFYRVRVIEQSLLDIFQWNELALNFAFQLIEARSPAQPMAPRLSVEQRDRVSVTEEIFLAIAKLSGNSKCQREVAALNDYLRSIRIHEDAQWSDLNVELDGLLSVWHSGEVPLLRLAVASYNRRRMDKIRQLVALAYRTDAE